MSMEQSYHAGIRYLERQGMALTHVFDTAALPRAVAEAVGRCVPEAGRFSRLVLMAHGGGRFWQALRASRTGGPDPVDTFSTAVAETLLRRYLGDPPARLLYPSALPLPLQQLGSLAGWSHPSPLGLGIHARFGTWFAYRAAILVAAPLPVSATRRQPSPCERCAEKPCIAACPGRALVAGGAFRLAACTRQRLAPASPCAASCAARLACPVGAEHRYSPEQIAYHACRSLASLEQA